MWRLSYYQSKVHKAALPQEEVHKIWSVRHLEVALATVIASSYNMSSHIKYLTHSESEVVLVSRN